MYAYSAGTPLSSPRACTTIALAKDEPSPPPKVTPLGIVAGCDVDWVLGVWHAVRQIATMIGTTCFIEGLGSNEKTCGHFSKRFMSMSSKPFIRSKTGAYVSQSSFVVPAITTTATSRSFVPQNSE